jgi:uncharacterized hydrophobic protein (TIGR00271 family)
MTSSDAPRLRTSPWRWWRHRITSSIDHVAVVGKVRGEAGFDGRYAFMILMSAGIAMLGLLLSSPAVVIGAMLISPLMGPIIGLGFGLATFDWDEIRRAGLALLVGVAIAVCFCALIVLASPIQNVTEEIAARTRPNLFDLLVALFSALAGAYAMVRGREGTIVGVAIATALMPPLAVVGFGLATTNWTVFGGALLLFFTNLMTIALAAAMVARFYGFGTHLSPQHTLLQTLLAFGVFAALAVPLGLALRQIAFESVASRQAREVIAAQFGADARLSQVDVDFGREPIRVSAVVLTPELQAGADRATAATLARLFGRPVEAQFEQYRVGTATQAEAAQLSAARSSVAQAATHAADQLALAAGVPIEQVTVDRERKRVLARAAVLPGARLAAYRMLEQRVAASEPGWEVVLTPPAAALDPVSFGEDGPDAAGRAAIDGAIWGARRLGLPIGVSGARADEVAALLAQAGIAAEALPGDGESVALRWQAPAAP